MAGRWAATIIPHFPLPLPPTIRTRTRFGPSDRHSTAASSRPLDIPCNTKYVMSCRRGDRDFFVMRFPSYSQGRCVSICSACNPLHDRLWCRGMALRARACPLVEIAHLFSWPLGSNVEQWSMAGCGFPERDFAHICSDGARAYPSCAMSFLAGYEALAWRYARAHAPWSK